MPTTEETIAAYDALLERAFNVLGGPPYFKVFCASYSDCARLALEGDDAVLSWPVEGYDDWAVETVRARFPATLLTMPEPEFEAWRATAAEEAKRRRDEYETRRRRAEEAEERRLLAELQSKYAGGTGGTP